MPEVLTLTGTPVIEARLRRSARARRMSLRVSRLDGRVTLSIPRSLPLREAEAFLNERAAWLRQVLSEQAPAITVGPGVSIPIAGRPHEIRLADIHAARIEPDAVLVRADRPVPPQVAAVLRNEARRRLEPACAAYGEAIARMPRRVSLRDTRSRWGSCTSQGNLMFSWRLALAPLDVLDYVAAHEVAHLREMNHGSRFWGLVRTLCPEFETHRRWLHSHGPELHRYRFNAAAS